MKRIYKIKKKTENIINNDESIFPKIKNAKTCDKSFFPKLPSIVNVTDVNEIDRIISIGDIHGDLDLAIRYLEIPKLIKRVYKENEFTVKLWYKTEQIKRIYEWIGIKTIAVQVGDQIDRCRPNKYNNCQNPNETLNDEASDLVIMFFYNDLHNVALMKGCALYSLLGNHELLNVIGSMQYVSYKGLKEFPTSGDSKNLLKGRVEAFSLKSTNKIYKKKSTITEFLGCSRLTSIIVNGYLFAHAGIMKNLINYVSKHNIDNSEIIPTLNETIKSWLLSAYKESEKPFIKSLILGNQLSPFWPRIFGSIVRNLDIETKQCQNIIKPVLEALNIKGLIVGHTPQLKTNITSTCSNTIWRVDVASSKAFDQVIFNDIKSEKEKQKIQKGRLPQVLEIILSKDPRSNTKNNLDKFNILVDDLN